MRDATNTPSTGSRIKLRHIIIGVIVLAIIVVGLIANPFSINDADERTVVQPIVGKLFVQFEPGVYYAGFWAKRTVWPNNVTVQVSSEKRKSPDSDLHAMIQKGTFSEGDAAKISHTVKWDMPDGDLKMLKLHTAYGTINNLMGTTLLMYQQKIASFSCQRMSSEEHYSGGQSQLDEYFQDQLRNGQVLLITETKTRLLKDSTTKNYIEVRPRKNKDGSIRRSKSDIQKYDIIASFASIDQVIYDARIYEKLKAKIDAASDEATAKQELITAQQEALTEKAKGEKLIAKTRADEEAAKLEAVIRAEKEADVAEQNLKRDILKAKSELALKKAAAEGDRLKVLAGLTPLERAKIDKQTAIGVAAELAKVKFPTSMVIVGGGSKDGGGINPFDAVGLESFYNLSKKMSSRK